MPAYLAPVFSVGAQFFTNQGVILAGGKIFVYQAGTTTPVTTWTSPAQTVANTNPLVLDSAGRLTTPIWVAAGAQYKFVLTDSTGASVGMTLDNISGINDATYTNPPALNVCLSANYTGSAAYTPIKFQEVGLDNRSAYSASTGLYTVPVAGTYLVTVNVNYTTTATDFVLLYTNVKQYAKKVSTLSTADFLAHTYVGQYSVNDAISATMSVNTGTLTLVAKPDGGNTRGTSMNIALLSAS